MEVTVLLSNYKRPQNLPQVIRAFKEQTVPLTLAMVDSSGLHTDFPGVDHVFRFSTNFGCYNRLMVRAVQTKYTYIHDDDMLPGPNCLENFIKYFKKLSDCGVLGQDGRRVTEAYNFRSIQTDLTPEEVDFVVRGYFIESRNLQHVDQLYWRLLDSGLGLKDFYFEDFMVLSAGMNLAGLKNYVVPARRPKYLMNLKELDDSHAVCTRSDATERKNKVLHKLRCLGWKAMYE